MVPVSTVFTKSKNFSKFTGAKNHDLFHRGIQRLPDVSQKNK